MKKLRKHFPPRAASRTDGFTLLEVVIAMALTTVVLSVVFALLARGIKTPRVESERADVQAQTRSALESITRDVLQAGAGLPPEFPTFIPPEINPELLGSEGDTIELVANLDEQVVSEPVRVRSFDGRLAQLDSPAPHIQPGALVLVYDDAPTQGTWMFALVAEGRSQPPELVLKTRPGDSEGEVRLPWYIDNYNRPTPTSGFLTPVSVVRYSLAPDGSTRWGASTPERVLVRSLNWGAPQPVAYAENLAIRYVIGSTVPDFDVGPGDKGDGPGFRIRRPHPGAAGLVRTDGDPGKGGPLLTDLSSMTEVSSKEDLPKTRPPGGAGAPASPEDAEDGVTVPPLPQLDPRLPLEPQKVVRGVRITVSGRSASANLEGSKVAEGPDPNGYLRVTYTSRVAVRNLLFRLSTRGHGESFN